jgi:hypothetical protein
MYSNALMCKHGAYMTSNNYQEYVSVALLYVNKGPHDL